MIRTLKQSIDAHRCLDVVWGVPYNQCPASLGVRIVPTASVPASLRSYLESGDVDAAIVYHTDVGIAPSVRVAFPPLPEPRVLYPAALLSATPHAARFFEYLRSPAAAAIFRRYGFGIAAGNERRVPEAVKAA